MKYTLKQPCENCPFRPDSMKGWLGEERAEQIITSLTEQGQTFSCHKTNQFDDDTGEACQEGQHCAGALILLEKLEQPNQMMRIAERLGMYDRTKLDMEAPVFDEPEDFIEHHTKGT